MNLAHQARGVYHLPSLDSDQTWISYGALAAIHYDVDAESPYWPEPPWRKFTFKPILIDLTELEDK